jgi:hypothetical protein
MIGNCSLDFMDDAWKEDEIDTWMKGEPQAVFLQLLFAYDILNDHLRSNFAICYF